VFVLAGYRGAAWAVPTGVAASAGVFLSSAHLPILWSERLHHWPWILLTSLHLVGVIVLWGATGFALRRSEPVAR
jgi:hypothetical protein